MASRLLVSSLHATFNSPSSGFHLPNPKHFDYRPVQSQLVTFLHPKHSRYFNYNFPLGQGLFGWLTDLGSAEDRTQGFELYHGTVSPVCMFAYCQLVCIVQVSLCNSGCLKLIILSQLL